ncbi:transposase [Methylobacterium sp. GXS13]|uniref:IS1182 family transposase n=1 Tax=Methylobacterium sp. GXS13 TaxID=1730094 RepID=UPI00071C1DC8|nr:IS1182 family transposase [Methylobacterium sp. GXS13]KST60417.1 transposase [Methylobacterium sp. GXS13]
MKRFIAGEDRQQITLLPDCLDDYITGDNPVRLVEVFVDELDLTTLPFAGAVPEATGRPADHPAILLKIYLYGHLNRVPSSRRLERESQRNIELIWLTGRLMPDFKTLTDFRKDNGPAIQAACAQFVVLCRRLNLFSNAVVAIDGSKFKAVNNRDTNFTTAKVEARLAQVEASIGRYLATLDRADREPSDIAEARTTRLRQKIAGLRELMQVLRARSRQVEAAVDGQVSLTDPDARSMATRGKGTGMVGYNVQVAVDAEHHLIVAHDVTNIGSDRAQLAPMGLLAQAATGCDTLTVLADRGYLNGEQVLACEGTGVLPCVPKTLTSGYAKRGLFTGQDVVYDAEQDHYTCPAGQHLTKGPARSDRRAEGDEMDHYRNLTACLDCALKPCCTPAETRRVKRWVHAGVLDAMQARLDRMPDAMKIRRQTVEHPFGTLKAWMGATHLLTRISAKLRTEMSLQVLAYNMKRMIQIFGVGSLMAALRA